jgi:uncharacterized protein with GYD domain
MPEGGVVAVGRRKGGARMARYLWKVSYTAEGAKGLLAEGGTSRKNTIQKLIRSLGGKLVSFDFAFGDDDAYVIAEVKDATDVAAVSLAVAAAGGARVTTVQLLTPDQMDAAAKKNVAYRAPGA